MSATLILSMLPWSKQQHKSFEVTVEYAFNIDTMEHDRTLCAEAFGCHLDECVNMGTYFDNGAPCTGDITSPPMTEADANAAALRASRLPLKSVTSRVDPVPQ
jgi:hypothetical protein